jgi:hypothetical protein
MDKTPKKTVIVGNANNIQCVKTYTLMNASALSANLQMKKKVKNLPIDSLRYSPLKAIQSVHFSI